MTDGRALLLAHQTEAQFQRQVITWAKRSGFLVLHVHNSRGVLEWGTDKGFPDLVLAKAGEPLYLPELKSMQGRLSDAQGAWLTAIRGATSIEAPVWRPDDADAIRGLLCGV